MRTILQIELNQSILINTTFNLIIEP